MRFRPVLLLSIFLAFNFVAHAADEKPGLLNRTLQTLHLAPRAKKDSVHVQNLTLNMDVAPQPVKLPETRQMKVTLSLLNRSKKFVHLEFPTTQRIDIVVSDKTGKTVTRWSEDQSFANEPAYVTINPGERIEYNASVATRDLVAGEPYTIDGFFPNVTELRIQKTIVPEK